MIARHYADDPLPCTCRRCRDDPYLLTGVGVHQFLLENQRGHGGAPEWRWTCACSLTGGWRAGSPGRAFHHWRCHAGLELGEEWGVPPGVDP